MDNLEPKVTNLYSVLMYISNGDEVFKFVIADNFEDALKKVKVTLDEYTNINGIHLVASTDKNMETELIL